MSTLYVVQHFPTGMVMRNPEERIKGPFRFHNKASASQHAADLNRRSRGTKLGNFRVVRYDRDLHGPVINRSTGEERQYDDPL